MRIVQDGNGKSFTVHGYDISHMGILTDAEKRAILLKAQTMAKNDDLKKWNMIELGAALKIIEKTLGIRWYKKSGKELNMSKASSPPTDYNFLLHKQKLPPITALLRGGRPENYGKIIAFATYLKMLWDETNIREKVREYERKERNTEISFERFNKLFFELKIAAFCKRGGLEVYFIPEQKKRKTPDLKISSFQGATYIECKKKDPQTKEETEISSICQQIETRILNIMMEQKCNYSINITFKKRIEQSMLKPLIEKLNQLLFSYPLHFSEDLDEQIHMEGIKLADFDVIQSSKNVPAPPDISKVQHFTWSAETQKSNIDYFNLHNLDVPIRNYRQVAIFSTYIPSKVQSILNSVKDASEQLSKSSGYGIIAIEVVLGDKTPQMFLQQALISSSQLLQTMPHIQAVMFFIEQVLKEGEVIDLRTIYHGYINPATSKKLPSKIEDAIKTSHKFQFRSLLDDST